MPRGRGWSRWTARAAAVIATATLAAGTLGAVPAHAADGDFEFTVSEGNATITGFAEDVAGVTDLVIPQAVSEGEETYPVVGIGNNAFQYQNGEDYPNPIATVTLPEGLESIGSRAFNYTTVTSVQFPASLTSLGAAAFMESQDLTSVTFADGSSLTAIPAQAFRKTGLTAITLPDTVVSIGDSAFQQSKLASVALPSVGGAAFSTNVLTAVTLPTTLETLGEDAFAENALASLTLPASITELGRGAFRDNQITGVSLASGSALAAIPAYAFRSNELAALELPTSVTSIGEAAFADNEISELALPDHVASVGDHAFANNAFVSVTIEATSVTLGSNAFGRLNSKGGERGFDRVSFAAGPPSDITEGGASSPSFRTNDDPWSLSGTTLSVPAVVYQPEFEAPGYEGGFTTPTWRGYPAAAAGSDIPVAPAQPTATADEDKVTVSWSPPDGHTDVTGYKVRLTPVPGYSGTEQIKYDVAAGVTTVDFEDVHNGRYQAYVTATSEAGDSPESVGSAHVIVNVIAVAVPGTPAAPRVHEVDGSDATLLLTKVTNDGGASITSYTMTLTPVSGDSVTKTFAVGELIFYEEGGNDGGGQVAQATVSDLTSGTYTAKVHATNEVGDSDKSAESAEFTIEADPDPTQQVAAEIEAGEKIVVSGTGWKTTDGTKGSIIGLKLDTGTVTRTFDLTWPEDTTANDATKANRTIWGVVQADASGTWSVELPYPTSANSDADLSGWTDGSTHSVQVLSGSLLTGDAQRSVPLSFTVTGTLPDTAVDTTVTADAVKQVYGKTAKLPVTVSPDATGEVSVKAGSKTITGTLTGGKVKLTLPAKALKPGRRNLTVSYAGVEGQFKPSTGKANVTVAKAKPTVKVKAPAKVKRGKTATITVAVTADGVKPSGKVTVKIAGAKKTTATLKNGKAIAKLKLPKGLKPGKKKVVATYQGDTHVAKTKAKATTISVTK